MRSLCIYLRKLFSTLDNEGICRLMVTVRMLYLTIPGIIGVLPAIIQFTFQNSHYQDVVQGQSFAIMEGPNQIGEGKVISIEKCEVNSGW